MTTHPSTIADTAAQGQILPSITKFGTARDTMLGTLAGWPWRGLLLAAVGITGVLQHLTPLTATHWLYILQRLYYIPIVLAGLSMGLRGGLTVALISSVAFWIGTPHIWSVSKVDVMDQCLEACIFCLVGGVAGVLTDRRRKQDQALHQTTEELRRAHQELQNNFEGMKRAERLSALGQLSAGLAHEIRNPLASIEGAAAVVQRERQSEERRQEFLDIIRKESRRLNQLLTTFLSFAKPSPPVLKAVEIEGLLDSVIVLAQHAGEANGRDLRKDIQPGFSRLECDPEQLKQVLFNLVMNAMQATPPEGTVMLAAREDGNEVTIDVQDQGCGISKDCLDRVFDPFFTTKEAGTGLGLSTAYQIVSQHGGTLTVARNSPDGVTMRVSLPQPPNRT